MQSLLKARQLEELFLLCIYYPAQKKIAWETSRGQSLGKSLGVLEKSRIGSDPILFLTIFPRLWPRLLIETPIVTNVTILP